MRGISGDVAPNGVRTSSAARIAASPIAWMVVAIPPAAARSTQLAQRVGRRSSTRRGAGPVGAVDPARARCPRGARRSATRASRRRSTSASRPSRDRRGSRQAGRPLRCPCSIAAATASSRMHAWTRSGQPAGVRQPRVCRERVRQVRIGCHAARVVAGDDTERHELLADLDDRPHRGPRPRPAARGS